MKRWHERQLEAAMPRASETCEPNPDCVAIAHDARPGHSHVATAFIHRA
jgi:hypothetical protein